ncbi:MAG: hypothetical protein QOH97_796 [Actinoplanes sp.]|nr:hypothetical protein [Actinoplanes sp.]
MVAVNNFGDTRSGGLAGPMGLLIIVLMCIATVLLIRNMNKRVRRLPDSFQDSETTRRQAEVAQLNADLESPDAAHDPMWVDGDRSTPAGPSADSEVTDVAPGPPPTGERAQTDRT